MSVHRAWSGGRESRQINRHPIVTSVARGVKGIGTGFKGIKYRFNFVLLRFLINFKSCCRLSPSELHISDQ